MDNIVDLIANDSSASEISDAIKDAILIKAADRINSLRSTVADSIFSGDDNLGDEE